MLGAEQLCFYIGFDPTASSLHIGNLLMLIAARHLQQAGHRPIILVGVATARIGDPSGKSEERKLLAPAVIKQNCAAIKKQLLRYLDFTTSECSALLVDNYEWFERLPFLEFIRDTGKYITVNYMLAKHSVKARIESEQGISFTEFTYQLMQAYDFWHLYTHYSCLLQLGGADQWGNMVSGTELIRKKCGKEAQALTVPLLTKSDGGKFGKTEAGTIWLDEALTSPFVLYQFWLNASDADAQRWIYLFTFLELDEIAHLCQEHCKQPEQRLLQKTLAWEVTALVHGTEQAELSRTATAAFFQSSDMSFFHNIAEETFASFIRAMPCVAVSEQRMALIELLVATDIFKSKSEARKMLINGGVYVNKEKIVQAEAQVSEQDWLFGKYILLQKGKKHFYVVKCVI